jgi:hypothetical protein
MPNNWCHIEIYQESHTWLLHQLVTSSHGQSQWTYMVQHHFPSGPFLSSTNNRARTHLLCSLMS